MIVIRFIGGAKKSFLKDELFLEADNISLQTVLDSVLSLKPANTADLDLSNVLVAINGADSSTMAGRNTIIQNGDVVSIIPIIHGGSSKRLDFTIFNCKVILMEVKNNGMDSKFLDSLRAKYPKLLIQAISNTFILGPSHFVKIVSISLEAQKNKSLLSKKFETDLLLRFAGTTQISKAINDLGIKQDKGFFLICIGNKSDLESVYLDISSKLSKVFSLNNEKFLRKYFKITNIHLDSVLSKTPLEDILAERSTVLF